jgi:hypothetical protein
LLAIVLAYKRPQLTSNLIKRLLGVDEEFNRKFGHDFFSDVLIVHDGIREIEDVAGEESYLQTRLICKSIQATSRKITSVFYDTNVGLTNHIFRVVRDSNNNPSECIFFEEDKAPTLESIEFLWQNLKSGNTIDYLDTLPFNKHFNLKEKSLATLFTDIGNFWVSDELFQSAYKLWNTKQLSENRFEENLLAYLSSFLSGFGLKRALQFYSRALKGGVTNVDRTDSLFACALILNKNLKTCPIEPLSEDWSGRDARGKNVNKAPEGRGRICSSPTVKLWGFDLCPDCEKQGVSDRVGLTLSSTIRNSLEYRTRRIRHLI